MRTAVDPASVVICAELPTGMTAAARAAWGRHAAGRRCPVTWAADPETIAAAGPVAAQDEFALAIAPEWLDSKRTLRERIATARQELPGLTAAVLRGPRPLDHHALLAAEGIRIVVVDAFGPEPRGSRRPAPAGWACRHPVWGLWEVRAAPRESRGLWGWLNGPLSRLRPGSLRILRVGKVPMGPSGPVSTRLDRYAAWAERRQTGQRARVVGLSDLAITLAGGGEPPLTGSILKAA
jgi:hypothetical protein